MIELFLGIDIGGSHISLGLVNANHDLIEKESFDFNPNLSPHEAVDKICDVYNQLSIKVSSKLSQLWKLMGIGLGCPGQAKNGILIAAANFPQFRNVPLADMLSNRFNQIPVVLLNDADAALFAELKCHQNKNIYTNDERQTPIQNACMISIGTGIGVSLYINNTLYSGSNGLIEAGHIIIDFSSNARLCGCGQRGCVEAYASCKNTVIRMIEKDSFDRKKVVKSVAGIIADDHQTSSENVTSNVISSNKTGISSSETASSNSSSSFVATDEMNAKWVFDRATVGDVAAESVLHVTIQALACLCINICRMVDPEVIILSGGMSLAGESFRQRIEDAVHKLSWTVLPTTVKIVISSNISDVGIIGAAIAIQEELLKC